MADRIASISQPHVRPMVRGKARSNVEFGAKISVSLVNGFSFVDRISWDNYNESGDLLRRAINTLHSIIPHMFLVKIVLDYMRLPLTTAEITPHMTYQLVLVMSATPPDGVSLYILIENFIRIQFWTITRKEE